MDIMHAGIPEFGHFGFKFEVSLDFCSELEGFKLEHYIGNHQNSRNPSERLRIYESKGGLNS